VRLAFRAAIVVGLAGAALVPAARAAAEPIAVIGEARPAWMKSLLHELATAGFVVTPGDQPWALRVTAEPDRIAIVRRAADGDAWTVDEQVAVPRAPAARRRAIVRAVEILRARRAAGVLGPPTTSGRAGADTGGVGRAAAPSNASPAKTAPAPTPPEIPAAATAPPARPAPRVSTDATSRAPAIAPPKETAAAPAVEITRARAASASATAGRFSLGVVAGVSGSSGGLGAVPTVGLQARWMGQRLALWSRADGAVVDSTVSGMEGTAAVRTFSLVLGGGWLIVDAVARRWSPFVGGETTGLFARAVGQGAAGYNGQTVVVAGMAIGAAAGLWFLVGDHLGVAASAQGGVVVWEPVVTFAGRRAGAFSGPRLAATIDLSWRF